MCRGLNGSFVGDSTCGSQGCCTIGACVWSEWSVCDCLDVIESKRTRSRREIALPNGWPPIPNCLPMVESNVCRQCLKGNSTDTAAEPTPAFFDNDALLAAAQMDASTFEALFIAFLVLLLLTWVALAVFCFYQRRAAESRVVALPEPLEHRPTDLSQYAEAPTAPVHTGTYAAASLHSRGSGSTPYGEAPRSSTGQYLPVGSQSSGEENYVDVPSPQFTQAMLAKQPSQTNIVTTYVPVPRGKAGTTAAAAAAAAARRPTGGAALPAPIATMHDNNNNAYV